MAKTEPVLRLENVSKLYDGETPFLALDRINIEIAHGELIAIIGPSGSGKSTLLHMLGCLDRPSGGEIYVDGVPLSRMNDEKVAVIRRDTLGFVFQAFNLAPTMTVFKNVELPLMISGADKKERMEKVKRHLEEVGLSDKKNNLPSQLSGGQKQRVAIARALSNDPKIILADEPTGNLDSKSGEEIMKHIIGLCRDGGITVILVTHDPYIAARADRIIKIKDGRIESDTVRKARRDWDGKN
ncbi:MAG: ABC transporter ATP-binding protein [Candidatus Micrarchaeia archaeon]